MLKRNDPNRLIVIDGEADTAEIRAWELTRRQTIKRGLVVGGVSVVTAAQIPVFNTMATAFAQADGDAAILESAVGLEQVAVFAYKAAANSGALDAKVKAMAELFREQEQEHADALAAALQELGGERPAKPKNIADIDRVLPGLAEARTQRDIAMFAIELETAAVAAYYDAHQKLRTAKLLQTGASIMANEGQHLVVLRQTLGENRVPNAFETGQR